MGSLNEKLSHELNDKRDVFAAMKLAHAEDVAKLRSEILALEKGVSALSTEKAEEDTNWQAKYRELSAAHRASLEDNAILRHRIQVMESEYDKILSNAFEKIIMHIKAQSEAAHEGPESERQWDERL